MLTKGIKSAFAHLTLFFTILQNVNGQNEAINNTKLENGYPRDALSNFTEFASNYGYVSEEHTVITEDGYILSIFRIPKGKNCKGPVEQTPVLLMHGLLLSSDSWLDAGPSAGLAFLISDACYDLWVGNVRGSYYGRRNVVLNPDSDTEFWKFSTNEMAIYDIPATIDYMLNYTGSADLLYVGFSQGCRLLFIMCSETSGYCNKIRVSINLAPAVRLKYTRSVPVRLLTEVYSTIIPYLNSPRKLEVLQKGDPIQEVGSALCKDTIFAGTICKLILTFIDAFDPGSILTQTVRVLYGHFPAGTSAQNLAFYGQNAISGRFQKYDYGPSKNLERYRNIEPPLYNLNRTTIPVVLVYGRNDFLVDPRDVQWLSTQVPNLLELYEVKNPAWTHLDNVYSQNTKSWIFPKISEYLQKYSTGVSA